MTAPHTAPPKPAARPSGRPPAGRAAPSADRCLQGRGGAGPHAHLGWIGAILLALGSPACLAGRLDPPIYQPTWMDSGIVVQDLLVPTDWRLPDAEIGDLLTIHFEARLADGALIDSSYERGLPVEFVLGEGQVPPGLDEGLIGMRERGRRVLIVPPALAYGSEGIEGQVPPGASVRFEIELLRIGSGGQSPVSATQAP